MNKRLVELSTEHQFVPVVMQFLDLTSGASAKHETWAKVSFICIRTSCISQEIYTGIGVIPVIGTTKADISSDHVLFNYWKEAFAPHHSPYQCPNVLNGSFFLCWLHDENSWVWKVDAAGLLRNWKSRTDCFLSFLGSRFDDIKGQEHWFRRSHSNWLR